ncbi:DoxX family protein [Halorussus salinisoli]|uniref:DoxX family protein n=1 Tax=Halorussus salinisoli TaxID=2558242 RepID=UPI0010C1F9C4|nr:DoxX family protein [Halorussus salinisoli]
MPLLGSESTGSVAETARQAEEKVTEESPPKTHSTSFKLARVLFGGVLAFMAVDNFRNLEETIEYAESQGAPIAETSVPFISGSLLFGGLGIAAWKLPRLAAGAVATFFVGTTPIMHDFWTIDDEQEKQQQMIHFLKNVALLGGALAFLRIGQDD